MKMYRAMELQNTSDGADSKSGFFARPTLFCRAALGRRIQSGEVG
jgi:hypothetical protein